MVRIYPALREGRLKGWKSEGFLKTWVPR